MPLINEFKIVKESKRFQKKAYRPWDQKLETEVDEDSPVNADLSQGEYQCYNDNRYDSKEPQGISTDTPIESYDESQFGKILRDLFGSQKVIFKHLLKNIEEKDNGGVITIPISILDITNSVGLPVNTIRMALGRLKQKKLLDTYEYKPGRGGYSRYKISQSIYEYFYDRV